MQLSLTIHAHKLRLISISHRTLAVSLILLSVSGKFLTVLSISIIATIGNTAVIACINNKAAILSQGVSY